LRRWEETVWKEGKSIARIRNWRLIANRRRDWRKKLKETRPQFGLKLFD